MAVASRAATFAVTQVARDRAEKVLRGTVAGDPFEVRADAILVAVGRTTNTMDLGLEKLGVAVDTRGAIVVDERQRTDVASIFAAGDVTTQPRYLYVAAAAGAAAASNDLELGDERLDLGALPQIIFTSPAIAQAGLTEKAAIAGGLEVDTTLLPLDAVPRALVNVDTRGLFKLVTESGSGRLVGVSILADGAPDVIQAAVLAIEHGMTAGDLARTWAPYLAMAEGSNSPPRPRPRRRAAFVLRRLTRTAVGAIVDASFELPEHRPRRHTLAKYFPAAHTARSATRWC